jgi:hypothetical protein
MAMINVTTLEDAIMEIMSILEISVEKVHDQ